MVVFEEVFENFAKWSQNIFSLTNPCYQEKSNSLRCHAKKT